MEIHSDTHYLSLALSLAERGRLHVSPNPMVGCVIVKNNRIVGQGYHERWGEAHAEVIALKNAGDQAIEATLYVTLEPCCHFGKTPPCTAAIIESGIKKVIIACFDPNPLVAGKGVEILKKAGIIVEIGCLESEAKKLNTLFFYYIKNKRPYVIAKWAMSLDGKTCVNAADNKQISGLASQQKTHQLRQEVDAIVVGANTVRDDNPLLTVRISNDASIVKQPIRIVIGGKNPLKKEFKIFQTACNGKVILVTTKVRKRLFLSLQSEYVELLVIPENEKQLPSLPALLDELGKRGIQSILVEGGMTLHENFFAENLVNKIDVYIAPCIIGSGTQKKKMHFNPIKILGNDVYLSAEKNDV